MKTHASHAGGRRARRPVEPVLPVVSVLPVLRPLETQERESMIAEAAYYRAEARGFEPGHELEDWLAAEREIDRLLDAERLADH